MCAAYADQSEETVREPYTGSYVEGGPFDPPEDDPPKADPIENKTAETTAEVTPETPAEEPAPETAPEPETMPAETVAEEEAAPAEEPVAPIMPLDEYRAVLDEHFQSLRALIKYTKTKDETIQKLSKELQKYREDYSAKTFKSIATLVISYREDCRKSLVDLDTFEIAPDKAKKFVSYLCDDLEELLSNIGCEENDDEWEFNGKPLSGGREEALSFPVLFEAQPAEDEPPVIVGADLRAYLQNTVGEIQKTLADNEMLDKCLKDYCTLASVIEEDIVGLCVYPPVRKLVSLFRWLTQQQESLSARGEEDYVVCYRECLTYLVARLEDVLLCGSVMIDTSPDNVYDTRKHRLIKSIPTDNASQDRAIAKQYTECYTMNGVVIYPAKVDVYKYQAPQA